MNAIFLGDVIELIIYNCAIWFVACLNDNRSIATRGNDCNHGFSSWTGNILSVLHLTVFFKISFPRI